LIFRADRLHRVSIRLSQETPSSPYLREFTSELDGTARATWSVIFNSNQEQALMNNLNVANFQTINLSDLDAINGGRGWGEAIGNYVGTAIGGAAGAVGGGLGGAAVGSAVPVIGTTIGGLAGGGAGGAVGGAAGWEAGGALGKWITGGR